jgi:iron(III) transport system substrate-binding protein
MIKRLLAIAGAAMLVGMGPASAQFGPPELIQAAKKEGRLVLYTANFAEVEQQIIREFNKKFPEIRVEMVRAPGGQLLTRFKTEAAAGKLNADVMVHSDRGLLAEIADQFLDYAPPNAADYHEAARASDKHWPAITTGWVIAYNAALVKNPPKTWMDLIKPEYSGKKIGQVAAPSGGTTWTRTMFERQVLGEDYHANQAKLGVVLYPSGAPTADALVRGEVEIAPLLSNLFHAKMKDGAPVEAVYPPEGVPMAPFVEGIPKTAKNPNAARLFLNWRLSVEGQKFLIEDLGHLTSLKNPPAYPKGWDIKTVKVWYPKFAEFEKLRESWIADWNKIYNYRQ